MHNILEYREVLGEDPNIHLKIKIKTRIIIFQFVTIKNISFLPKINNNSCARPNAKTGIKHLPPRLTISLTSIVKRRSRSSRFS